MNAQQIAQKAAELVGGDRDRQHGAKRDNFERIAKLWQAWLSVRRDESDALTPHDVGVMMALLKIARTQSGAHNEDDYIDGAGYLSCAGEIAADEAEERAFIRSLPDKIDFGAEADFWRMVRAEEDRREAKKQGRNWQEDADPLAR